MCSFSNTLDVLLETERLGRFSLNARNKKFRRRHSTHHPIIHIHRVVQCYPTPLSYKGRWKSKLPKDVIAERKDYCASTEANGMGEKEERQAQTLDLLTQNLTYTIERNKLSFSGKNTTSGIGCTHQRMVVQQEGATWINDGPLLDRNMERTHGANLDLHSRYLLQWPLCMRCHGTRDTY